MFTDDRDGRSVRVGLAFDDDISFGVLRTLVDDLRERVNYIRGSIDRHDTWPTQERSLHCSARAKFPRGK